MAEQQNFLTIIYSKSFPLLLLLVLLHSDRKALGLNPVLDLNGTYPYLINKTDQSIIEPRNYMDFDNLYVPNETYKSKQTAQGRNYHMIKAFDFANYFRSDYWHYSSQEDLKLSGYPVANAERCAQDLNWFERQLNESTLFGGGQQHINLMTLVDSFGRPEASTYFGHGYWLGSYYECLKVSIDLEQFDREECYAKRADPNCLPNSGSNSTKKSAQMKSRYCIGKARDIDWPENDDYTPKVSYKIGLCIPESCDTISFQKHSTQIERLMKFNMPHYIKNRTYLFDMYCLPDPKSPLRSLSLASQVFLGLNALWLIVLITATAIYSCYRKNQKDLRNIISGAKQSAAVISSKLPVEGGAKYQMNGATQLILIRTGQQQRSLTMVSPSEAEKTDDNNNDDDEELPEERSFSSEKTSLSSSSLSIVCLQESPCLVKILQCLSIEENLKEFQEPPALLRKPGAGKKLRINLNALDSIKCLCCILVIFGHIIFIHMQHLSNIVHTIDLSFEMYPRMLIAFFNFVDTFFIISGMLTAYFVFKRFNKKSFSSPLIWISISLSRLLRLSPVYILILWFTKTTSVYLSDGPIWDYGTDKNSMRGLCINDPWWKSILYFGNVGSMQPICILPAWSIIVDSQYSLIIPPILFLILKHKRLAYLSLLVATVVSTAKMSIQLAKQTAVKPSDMAKVRLHVYPLISRFAAEFYNTAWNRLGPVAIGIFGGHMLYLYDIGKIKQWPWFMRGIMFKLTLFLHVIIFILPTMSKYTENSSSSQVPTSAANEDLTIFLLSNAAIKPIWSMINTIFLLRLITDLRKQSVCARLASHSIWHCLGKLCFASYLLHYEVIMYLLKSRQDGLVDPNWSNAGREFSFVFLISTILAYFVYILYEAPINKLITLIMTNSAYCKKELNEKAKRLSFEAEMASATDTEPESNENNQKVGPLKLEKSSFTRVNSHKPLIKSPLDSQQSNGLIDGDMRKVDHLQQRIQVTIH